MKKEIEKLKVKLEHYLNELEKGNYDVEQEVVDFETEIMEMVRQFDYQDDFRYKGNPYELNALKSIIIDIKRLKNEFDFYDEETELDMMFPNRHDDDFDDDDMSYDSVFGDN